jgi:methyl-accepting chemotaxis protein
VHFHTKLLQQAIEWEKKEQNIDLLLHGSELATAEAWLAETQQNNKQPRPTDLQKNYLEAGRIRTKRQSRRVQLLTGLSAFLITLFTVFIIYLSGGIAGYLGQQALTQATQSHIISIRDTKSSQIENYFNLVFNQLQVYANARNTIDAMRAFKEAYPKFKAEAVLPREIEVGEEDPLVSLSFPIDKYKDAVHEYYVNDFSQEYGTLNINEALDMTDILDQVDDNSIALQYYYIADNPNPLGTKEEFFAANDASSYTQLHRHYHPYMHDIQRRFGFEDIFLIDHETGHIIYSVLKQIDFATSLLDGPYAKTDLGQISKKVSQGLHNSVSLVDFAPYLP